MEPICYIIIGRRNCGKTTLATKLSTNNSTCKIYDQILPKQDDIKGSWIYICQTIHFVPSFIMQSATQIFTYIPKSKCLFVRQNPAPKKNRLKRKTVSLTLKKMLCVFFKLFI